MLPLQAKPNYKLTLYDDRQKLIIKSLNRHNYGFPTFDFFRRLAGDDDVRKSFLLIAGTCSKSLRPWGPGKLERMKDIPLSLSFLTANFFRLFIGFSDTVFDIDNISMIN